VSQFLTNIINRHSSRANIVRPRTKSVFEKKAPYTGANSASFEADENLSYPTSTNSEQKTLSNQEEHIHSKVSSKVNQANTQDYDIPIQNNSTNTEDTPRTLGPKKRQVISNPNRNPDVNAKKNEISTRLKGNNSQSTKQPLNNSNNGKNEKVVLNTISKVNRILEEPKNAFDGIKSAKQFENALSNEIVNPLQIEKTPLNFNKEIHQNLITNLNIRNYNDNTEQVKDSSSPNGNSTPTIKIQIGRIDIKAVKQSPIKQSNTRKQNSSGKSLEQFLKERENK